MSALAWLVLASALRVASAQAPAPATLDAEDEAEIEIEINVYGERAIRQAREALLAQFADLGWRSRDRGDGSITLIGPSPWMGRAHLTRDGSIDFSRPAVAFQSAQLQEQTAVTKAPEFQSLSRDLPEQRPLPQLSLGVPEKRKVKAAQARVLAEVQPSLLKYRDVIAGTQLQLDLQSLAEQLDALWADGTPLLGDEALPPNPGTRRRAILAYWATRTDSREGLAFSRAVEAWVENTLRETPDAPTEAELAESESVRADGRRWNR